MFSRVIEQNKQKPLATIEKEQIINALKLSNGKIEGNGGAAKILNIAPSTLRDKVKKHGLNNS